MRPRGWVPQWQAVLLAVLSFILAGALAFLTGMGQSGLVQEGVRCDEIGREYNPENREQFIVLLRCEYT